MRAPHHQRGSRVVAACEHLPLFCPQATGRDGAVTAGVVETFAGSGGGETAGTCALFFVTGLMSIGFGVVLFAHPNLGAPALALLPAAGRRKQCATAREPFGIMPVPPSAGRGVVTPVAILSGGLATAVDGLR